MNLSYCVVDMISVQKERLQGILGEIIPLWGDHYDEISSYKDVTSLEPDYNRYFAREDEGTLVVYTARDSGKLVGYIFFVIGQALHYKSLVIAENDLFYVMPKYRGNGLGKRLLSIAEWYLKDVGIDLVHMRTKIKHDFGELLEDEGYRASERLFIKRLN